MHPAANALLGSAFRSTELCLEGSAVLVRELQMSTTIINF